MGFDHPKPKPAAVGSAAGVVHRGGSLVRVLIALSWIVGITGSFLTVGVIGMFADDLPPIHLKTLEDLEEATELSAEDAPMGELMSTEASTEQSAETDPVLPVEIPDVVQTPQESLDLPDIVEAMTTKDVFAVPSAPKIEEALRPVDPVKRQIVSTPSRSRTAPVASKGGTGSTTNQAGVAGGVGSSSGSGMGNIYRPKPPYPEFASRAGMQGTVRLRVSVGPTGAIESVTVISTTGFSALDEYTASYVRRIWRFPSGAPQRYNVPLVFRLN